MLDEEAGKEATEIVEEEGSDRHDALEATQEDPALLAEWED